MATYKDIKEINATLNTIDVKGKEYVEVNQRVKAFRMLYPEGIIDTHLESNENGVCVFKAQVGYYDEEGCVKWLATGYAYEKEDSTFINKTSYIENCETSAVGRALGMLGIGINTSIASFDEVLNAMNNQKATKEDAEKYKLTFGKYKDKTLIEVYDEDEEYIEWLAKNSTSNDILQYIDLLFNMKKSDFEVSEEKMTLTQEILKLIDEAGVDLDKIKDKYKINSLSEATETTLKSIKTKLEKVKEDRMKVSMNE